MNGGAGRGALGSRAAERRDDLAWYFGGGLEADAGLRSWLGVLMERGIPTRGEHPSTDGSDAAIGAARRERAIRTALTAIGPTRARVLRAAFTPAPPGFPHGLESLGPHRLVACLEAPVEHLRELVTQAAGPRSAKRAAARHELQRIQARTKATVSAAEDAFAAALDAARATARIDRNARFRAALNL